MDCILHDEESHITLGKHGYLLASVFRIGNILELLEVFLGMTHHSVPP